MNEYCYIINHHHHQLLSDVALAVVTSLFQLLLYCPPVQLIFFQITCCDVVPSDSELKLRLFYIAF